MSMQGYGLRNAPDRGMMTAFSIQPVWLTSYATQSSSFV